MSAQKPMSKELSMAIEIIHLKAVIEQVTNCAPFVDDAGNYAAAWHEKGKLEDHPIIKARKALGGEK